MGIKLKSTLTHVSVQHLWPVSLLTRLSYYGPSAEAVPGPEGPIPSFGYRKGKCGKNNHLAASLRHYG